MLKSKTIAPLKLKEIREAVANYMRSEGCNCCEGGDHSAHLAVLAKLLRVKKSPDGNWYDFSPHETKS